ncbi:hypothetical protein [Erythrobacter sp.]|uniref:hypothetical protein n=1 Tax=Erythrobacter sp. TaxID=1042 RepID=UPI003C718052
MLEDPSYGVHLQHNDAFFHVRMVLGVITSLAIARILNGFAKLVQTSKKEIIYSVHLLWSLLLFLLVLHFWWFEFALSSVEVWPFEAYAFLILYAALHFFISSLLFPDHLEDGETYESYFHSRRGWFFGLFALLFIYDMIDTAFKGWDHFRALGNIYPVRQVFFAALALSAIWIDNRRYHLGVVLVVIAGQIWWISTRYSNLS